MMKFTTKKLASCAVIAAAYVALCLLLAPVSYGPVQIRFAEALVLLPLLFPEAIAAVTVGCLLANMLGFMLGFDFMAADIFFGTVATLIAAVLTYMFRNVRVKNLPLLSAAMPVVVNAVVIGIELTLVFPLGLGFLPTFLVHAASVGLGEIVSAMILGLILIGVLRKTGLDRMFD